MPWRSFLIVDLKKSKRIPYTLLFIGFLGSSFFRPFLLFPLEIKTQVDEASRRIRLEAVLSPEESINLNQSLKEGYKSEIRYTFKIYERRKGISLFFGDQLLFQEQMIVSAKWDPISRDYVLLTQENLRYHFSEWEKFLQNYLTSPPFLPPILSTPERYLLCQILLHPRRFSPPLQILNFLADAGAYASPRTQMDLLP
ncbi:MAG TPA: hypothetical protein PLG79_10220 [Spirochaetales bacterium]|nr:hypothetical protein [Spirochaetales bacterium]HOV39088.1 hypothetical protein [Spirochaetales bacterium]